MGPLGSRGAKVDASRYQEQFEEKLAAVKAALHGAVPAAVLDAGEAHPSPPTAHRHRAGPLAVVPSAEEGVALELTMWDAESRSHSILRATEVPIYSPPIALAMEAMRLLPIALDGGEAPRGAALASGVEAEEAPWGRALGSGLRSVQFHSTLSGELLVCLVYHDSRLRCVKRGERLPGEEEEARLWTASARVLRAELLKAAVVEGLDLRQVDVVGRWKRRRLEVDRAGVLERFHLANGRVLSYWQPEGQFSNPNAPCEVHCLEWLCAQADAIREAYGGQPLRLLELHCGGGNNTVALAPHFEEVVAVEINRSLAQAAEENLAGNGIRNVQVVRTPSAEAARHHALLLAGDGGSEVVLVDPPRSGLDMETRDLVARFQEVLYISCNPVALAEDLLALGSHEVARFAFFDMFPYTTHAECAVHLRRRGEGSAVGAAA